jgi:restriction endonuclease S subunit
MLIAIPPLSVQKQISSILDKIDKKIANNNRINDNLAA